MYGMVWHIMTSANGVANTVTALLIYEQENNGSVQSNLLQHAVHPRSAYAFIVQDTWLLHWYALPGADSGGGPGGPWTPLGLHRYKEQYVYYPAVVHLSAFTVRSIILFTNAASLRINSPPERDQPRSQTALQLSIDMATKRRLSATQYRLARSFEEAVR